jgi:hypothetical protein
VVVVVVVVLGGSEVGGLEGRVVGKSGSVPVPHPGQVATPSTVLPHPAVTAAVARRAAAIPAFTRVMRTRPEYA